MKKLIYSAILFVSATAVAQEEPKPDTTRMNMGKVEIIVVDHSKDDFEESENDTIDAAPTEDEKDNEDARQSVVIVNFKCPLVET